MPLKRFRRASRLKTARRLALDMPSPPRDLGQHLLHDARAISRLLAASRVAAGARVLDAGAGDGAITRALASAVGPRGRVLAVELDSAMVAKLSRDLPSNVQVVEADLLEFGAPEAIDAVVANPPFKIAAPLVERFLASRVPMQALVLPRELAERLTAAPGTDAYGKLTIRVRAQASVAAHGHVPRRLFDPPPEVACDIVTIEPRPEAPRVDAAMLARVSEAAWEAWRRKTKRALAPLPAAVRADSAAFQAMLAERGFAEPLAVELAPEAYADIARWLSDHGKASEPFA